MKATYPALPAHPAPSKSTPWISPNFLLSISISISTSVLAYPPVFVPRVSPQRFSLRPGFDPVWQPGFYRRRFCHCAAGFPFIGFSPRIRGFAGVGFCLLVGFLGPSISLQLWCFSACNFPTSYRVRFFLCRRFLYLCFVFSCLHDGPSSLTWSRLLRRSAYVATFQLVECFGVLGHVERRWSIECSMRVLREHSWMSSSLP